MNIKVYETTFDPITKKHSGGFKDLGYWGNVIIDNGEYALQITYDAEYTGGFSIVPIINKKGGKALETS